MLKNELISITLPVYNEEENIQPLYKNLKINLDQLGRHYEIIFVNDGSSDGSEKRLDAISDKDPLVKVIHFRKNFGQTAAMMAGFDYASGEIIIPMDSDLQNDPADIKKLLDKIDEGFDVVSGWRKDRKDNPIKRNFPSRVANALISKLSGVHLNDYGCSLKAYRKDVIKNVKLYGEMHRFIPIYAKWEGAKITEVPVSHHPRKFGQSKYGMNRVVKVVLDLMVILFLERYSKKPIYVFGGSGVVFLGFSLVAFIYALVLKIVDDVSFIKTPLPIFTSMFFVAGVTSILMGFLAEMVSRTYHESQNKSIYSISRKKNL